ncbi:MAG: stage 0 sporulation protein, partial [Erysipelotrichaceae bacterium]|nr:stage 0 sporulation protein [Erysipelotrichaceae bacterium]
RFLDDFDIVSINMAKNQLLALNTQKLSGQCGKLMCCLKYEDDNYKSMRKGLPKLNALVEYEGEKFRITSMNLLNGSVRLSNRNNAIDMTLADLKKHLQIEDADDETEDN